MPTKISPSVSVLLLALTTSVHANFLPNGGFDTPNPLLSAPNYLTSITGAAAIGPTSAETWFMYNNSPDLTTTELLPTTDPLGSGFMIHVSSAGLNNGLNLIFPAQSSASASVDVFVSSGTAILYLFTGGGTINLAHVESTTTGVWETLTIPVTPGNPNQFVLYTGPAGGDFFADRASVPAVSPVPEQSPFWLSLALIFPVLLGLPCRTSAHQNGVLSAESA
jgi:hypothetical protein